MASDAFLSWADRSVLRPGREEPYLCIQDIVVFVRDLKVSKAFYVDQLGFELITEQCLPNGVRWVEVAPPDGTANLALVEPKPDRPEYKLIGGYGWVLFMAEDVHAKSPPQRMLLGSARGSDIYCLSRIGCYGSAPRFPPCQDRGRAANAGTRLENNCLSSAW
jgi:hypothetical protein